MRTFIAINLPNIAKNNIKNAVAYAKDSLDFASFTKEENLHITLAFLGESDRSDILKIKELLIKISKEMAPDKITINDIKIAPDAASPKMIWLLTDEKTNIFIKSLSKKIKEELDSSRIKYDKTHETNSHLTVARFSNRWQESFVLKNDKQKKEEILKIEDTFPENINFSFDAHSVFLFESIQKDGERFYVPIFESNFFQ